MKTIEELIGFDLSTFKLAAMTEVCIPGNQDIVQKSLGVFPTEDIAKAYISEQKPSPKLETIPVIVLTDGIVAFVIEAEYRVKIFDDFAGVKREALKVLSPLQRAVLNLPEPDTIIVSTES